MNRSINLPNQNARTRRSFLANCSLGLMGPFIIQNNGLSAFDSELTNAVVRQASDSEIYFVRENTPITIYLSKKRDGIETSSFCSERILPGNGISVHKHLHEDEIFYFISGQGILLTDNKETVIMPGSVAFIPKGTWHGLKNNGVESLVFNFGYSPAGFEDFFRQIGTLDGQIFKPRLKDEIAKIAGEYGMVYK